MLDSKYPTNNIEIRQNEFWSGIDRLFMSQLIFQCYL